MAYKQEPGRGPTATFKNLKSKGLLGPTVTEGEEERGKEKVTREAKTDVNPETGMKRLTITTTRSGSSGGSVPYSEAYKKADKTKYPTLEGFIEAAKEYKKKDVRVVEQIPTRQAVLESPMPKPRDIEIPKIKIPEEPETTITTTKKKKSYKSSRRPKPPRVKKPKGSGLVKGNCYKGQCFKF